MIHKVFLNGNRNLYFQLFTSLSTAFRRVHRLWRRAWTGEVSFRFFLAPWDGARGPSPCAVEQSEDGVRSSWWREAAGTHFDPLHDILHTLRLRDSDVKKAGWSLTD